MSDDGPLDHIEHKANLDAKPGGLNAQIEWQHIMADTPVIKTCGWRGCTAEVEMSVLAGPDFMEVPNVGILIDYYGTCFACDIHHVVKMVLPGQCP